MPTTVSVLAARLATDTQAQPRSTGYCVVSTCVASERRAATSASTRAKLCTTMTLPNRSPARWEISWLSCSTERCAWPVRRITRVLKRVKVHISTIMSSASFQLTHSESGTMTRSAMRVLR